MGCRIWVSLGFGQLANSMVALVGGVYGCGWIEKSGFRAKRLEGGV
jgi:hypothetical protein